MKKLTQVQIGQSGGSQVLSPAQKTFNRLRKKIEKQRKEIELWQQTIPEYQRAQSAELEPLSAVFNQHRTAMIHLLQAAYDAKGLSQLDKQTLSDLIIGMAEGVIQATKDEALKTIYQQHAGSDYDEDQAAEQLELQEMMKEMFGVDVPDGLDMTSPEAMMEMMGKVFEQEQARQEEIEEKRSSRKKTATQLANEEKLREAEQQVNQSVREVYRKLAAELHPDREPDEAERARKTELMARVNVAYDKQDLLALLQLQLEVEQIDQQSLDAIPETRLKHFNQVLKEQSEELEQDIVAIEVGFSMRFNINPEFKFTPLSVMRDLREQINGIKNTIATLEEDLEVLVDIKQLKMFLKEHREFLKYGY